MNRSNGFLKNLWSMRKSYLFLFPFALLFFMFYLLPVGISIFYSFTYNNMLEPPRFIGFENYINLFSRDDVFIIALKNTLLFAVIVGPGSYILSFLLAWVINNLNRRLQPIYVLVFYSPAIAGSLYVVFTYLFSGDEYGYINGFLLRFGFIEESIQWLTDSRYMSAIVIICVLWSSMGAGFLAFVAGIKNVDLQYYEAGAIDGISNRWQELYYITLPIMKPQLLFGSVMCITNALSIHEVTIALCGYPSTNYAVQTVTNHLWDYGYMRFEMGYASAIATILFVIMIGCNKAINALLRRVGR